MREPFPVELASPQHSHITSLFCLGCIAKTAGEVKEAMSDQPASNGAIALDSNVAHSGSGEVDGSTAPLSPKKRTRTNSQDVDGSESSVKRVKGVAPIKAE